MASPTVLPAVLPTPSLPAAVPLRALVPWAVFGVLLSLILIYFVGAEQSGAVHEFVHDGRHLLGFPCH